jgi:hypothetical protein
VIRGSLQKLFSTKGLYLEQCSTHHLGEFANLPEAEVNASERLAAKGDIRAAAAIMQRLAKKFDEEVKIRYWRAATRFQTKMRILGWSASPRPGRTLQLI